MITFWYMKGDIERPGAKDERFKGVVLTSSPTTFPVVDDIPVPNGGKIKAVRNLMLLCEIEQDGLDFVVDQATTRR